MKSLRWRLAFWFGSGVVLVMVVFVSLTYRYLDLELRRKNWQQDYPEHPDWTIHGSYSEAEIGDILGELIETSLIYGIPLCLLAVFLGYLLARRSLQPITQLNRQLKVIKAPDLSLRIDLAEVDPDFQTLVQHINELLARLEKSFGDMSDYAAKVAHELRTPLAILRLKMEQAGDRISPELAEELQSELHQLTHIVGQSLMVAKAEQGRLIACLSVFDLAAVLEEAVDDFALLAEEQGRSVEFVAPGSVFVQADAGHVRQIIHNLLTNALKHGQGPIRVKLIQLGLRTVLVISNTIRSRPHTERDTFGLGLRVVQTLVDQQVNLQYKHRQLTTSYSARLCLSTKAGPAPMPPSESKACIDPHEGIG